MKFQSKTDETIFVSEILPEKRYMFQQDLSTGLSIIWNRGRQASFMIDRELITINQDCMIFLTEFHMIEDFMFERMNVIQFNRPFYCIEARDLEIGCKGLLFFGASNIPRIEIPQERLNQFFILWDVFLMEMDESDSHKLEMLRAILKRFLILCVRIYDQQHDNFQSDHSSVGLIREFNYLVEQYYKSLTKVSDYADLLNKSPKTLSNIFNKYIEKTPLQIIHQRRLLEAKRMLQYTDFTIQEIADELQFSDIQSFSNFFKSRKGISPSQFRENSG